MIAYRVTQRTREIGVRLALGAEPRAMVARVVAGGARPALAGVVIGAALATASTRVLRKMLYDVSTDDPLTMVAIVAVAPDEQTVYMLVRRTTESDIEEHSRWDDIKESRVLRRGDVARVPAGMPHRFVPSGGEPWECR